MATTSPAQFAAYLAAYARFKLPAARHGSLLIRSADGGTLLLGVFGNGQGADERSVRQDLETARASLARAGAHEQGFGLSPDGRCWAILAAVEDGGRRTEMGKAFHLEMVRAEVEEALER